MKINLAKRREVMERSMRLGHCICEPRRSCPCAVFTDQGICPCAGERPEASAAATVKLTEFVRHPGCSSKIAPGDLEGLLARLPAVKDPAVLSGLAAADDAAIYRITDDLCLVQTVDVFTPCVDDAHLFGRICAANCLSDIYAMGGQPRTALSILGFPSETMSGEIMFQMLSGAMATLAEAGVALVGGHSIKDEEIKLGFAVTGVINPDEAARLDAPQPGDLLWLTKPLGTGVLAFARQIGRGHSGGLAAAEISMAGLNRAAAEAMRLAGASGCTDITGFGLFGHLARLLRSRALSARLWAEALPVFDGVLDLLRAEVIPGAIERNREFVGPDLHIEPGVEPARVQLGFDAQTSGGLLIAISPDRSPRLVRELAQRGIEGSLIGELAQSAPSRIVLSASRDEKISAVVASTSTQMDMSNTSSSETHAPGCCQDLFGQEPPPGPAADAQQAFGALLRAVQAPGALDEKTKELILFSLVLVSRCRPCFEPHFKRARTLGITQAELDEAAWCAVALGGAPVRMFYQGCLRELSAG